MDEGTLCHFLQLGKFIKRRAEKLRLREADGEEGVWDGTHFGKPKVRGTRKVQFAVAEAQGASACIWRWLDGGPSLPLQWLSAFSSFLDLVLAIPIVQMCADRAHPGSVA